MQAVIFGMLGISELHSRNASPVHICCASALKAKLEVDDSAEIETANASIKPALRIVWLREVVIFGSLSAAGGGALLMVKSCQKRDALDVTSVTRRIRATSRCRDDAARR